MHGPYGNPCGLDSGNPLLIVIAGHKGRATHFNTHMHGDYAARLYLMAWNAQAFSLDRDAHFNWYPADHEVNTFIRTVLKRPDLIRE